MPSWAFDMVGVFLGAMLGAIFGLTAHWWYEAREAKAQREALFRALHLQIGTITITPASSLQGAGDQYLLVDRRPHNIPVIGLLLNTDVLDAKKDANLIRALSLLQSALDAHNDALEHVKQAMIVPDTSRGVLEMCVKGLERAHENMRRNMWKVEQLLPPDRMHYPPLPPWGDEIVE